MRPLLHAELLSVGTELMVGETRDTNAGDLARELTGLGVAVGRIVALPDELDRVREAIQASLTRADLVVTTGGLGPTPDDLTREAIAAAIGEIPSVDGELERWLVGLFERRGLPFPDANRKQAWLIPSATAIPNDNGTAPGWWVETGEGSLVVALPGPPREMRPMWKDWVVPRLRHRGLGRPTAVVNLRTTGLGESLLADRLGSLLDRSSDPLVATYARADAVDVRISTARDTPAEAAAAVAETEGRVRAAIGEHVWATGSTTWPEAIAEALDARGWRLAGVEVAMRGALLGLLGEGLGDRLAFTEALPHRPNGRAGQPADPEHLAARVREAAGTEVGLAVEVRARGGDLLASIAVVDPGGRHRERRVVFLEGSLGRSRAAIAAAAVLLARLRTSS